MKSILTMLLVSLALCTAVVSAEAQEPLGTWYRNAPAATTEGTGTPDALVTGYNYINASNCAVFMEGNAAVVCVVSKQGIVACTANPATQTGMLAACQTGNIVAIYIPNLATGVFTQFITFLVK